MGKLFVLAATAALFLVLFGCAQNASIPSGIDAQGKQFRGTDGARVTIVEFSDFQCPYCAAAQPTLERLLHEYDGEVKLVYRHFPLDQIHSKADKEAELGPFNDQGKSTSRVDVPASYTCHSASSSPNGSFGWRTTCHFRLERSL